MKRFIVRRNGRGLTSERKMPGCRDGIRALDARVRHGGFASAYGVRSSGRYAPSHARWKTLTRFLSLATLMGSNPPHIPDKSPDAVMASGHWM